MMTTKTNDQSIGNAIHKMGFRENLTFGSRECYDLGTVRVAFFGNGDGLIVYAFASKPGGLLKYEVPIGDSVPTRVAVAIIKAIVQDELR